MILAFRRALIEKSVVSEEVLDDIDQKVIAEIEGAFRHAQDAPWPEISDLFTDVYTTYLDEEHR